MQRQGGSHWRRGRYIAPFLRRPIDWSLRAYQGDQSRHWPEVSYSPMPGLPTLTVPAMDCALGHEPTPEAFIGHLVACYREVYRVLRDDGVCWVVVGDSYAGSWGNYSPGGIRGEQRPQTEEGKRWDRPAYGDTTWRPPASYLRQGDLVGIPAMLFKALQGDGWIVRNDCCWHKINPMPESLGGTRYERHRIKVNKSARASNEYQSGAGTIQGAGVAARAQREAYYEQGIGSSQWRDCPGCPSCEKHGGYVLRRGSWRHTRAQETVLHLVKAMNYWSDQEAVREAIQTQNWTPAKGQNNYAKVATGVQDFRVHLRSGGGQLGDSSGRNPRSVLTPRPSSFAGQHYATFPPDLIRPLIRSSTPRQCCPECGSGWAAVVERGEGKSHPSQPQDHLPKEGQRINGTRGNRLGDVGQYIAENQVLDYRPTCACDPSPGTRDVPIPYTPGGDEGFYAPAPVPGVVLDPFFGSGTTGLEAREWGVDCVGCDLSYDYLRDQARERLGFVALDEWEHGRNGQGEPLSELPLFTEVAE